MIKRLSAAFLALVILCLMCVCLILFLKNVGGNSSTPRPTPRITRAAVTSTSAPSVTVNPKITSTPKPTRTAVPLPKYSLLAEKNDYFFVVVSPEVGKNRSDLNRITDKLCKSRDFCVVLFWDDRSKAATSLPMTDAQVNSEVAIYNLNKNTGLDRLLLCGGDSPDC